MKEYLKESVIPSFVNAVRDIDNEVIEDTMIALFKGEIDKEQENIILKEFHRRDIELDIEVLTYIFESLLDRERVIEHGIVFTPEYIASFICQNVMNNITEWTPDVKIIDPGCGCGIFLIKAIDCIQRNYNIRVKDIVVNNIYGIDLEPDNVRRCKKIIKMLVELDGDRIDEEEIHIKNMDSLKTDWSEAFSVSGFDYIVGNPPYVNTHDMSKDTVAYLKSNFKTTQSGVFNIFYAFMEYGVKFLKPYGKLSYIIPNNFLTIKSAQELRAFLQKEGLLCELIDFADNMVFRPVRTYNCIIVLDKTDKSVFQYTVLDKSDDLAADLETCVFHTMPIERLDKNGWNLVDQETYNNLFKIENQGRPIKDYIRTGIATLKDEAYMVSLSEGGFYKEVNGVRYEIEREIVKTIYKIPELKRNESLRNVCRYIIFPYQEGENGVEIIPEDRLMQEYPNAYKYLVSIKSELDSRDKGKKNPVAWYAYGRTQGLTKFGRKLLFPTFTNTPKFILVEDETALFCNGYGVFENDYLELEELLAVLNSKVMQYYVANTSYAIEGGYYCYQKKYIERFSIPKFNENEKSILRMGSQQNIDEMLVAKYGLVI